MTSFLSALTKPALCGACSLRGDLSLQWKVLLVGGGWFLTQLGGHLSPHRDSVEGFFLVPALKRRCRWPAPPEIDDHEKSRGAAGGCRADASLAP